MRVGAGSAWSCAAGSGWRRGGLREVRGECRRGARARGSTARRGALGSCDMDEFGACRLRGLESCHGGAVNAIVAVSGRASACGLTWCFFRFFGAAPGRCFEMEMVHARTSGCLRAVNPRDGGRVHAVLSICVRNIVRPYACRAACRSRAEGGDTERGRRRAPCEISMSSECRSTQRCARWFNSRLRFHPALAGRRRSVRPLRTERGRHP